MPQRRERELRTRAPSPSPPNSLLVPPTLPLFPAGYVVFDDFFRIMKKKSDNPLDDLDDDDDV